MSEKNSNMNRTKCMQFSAALDGGHSCRILIYFTRIQKILFTFVALS